MKSKSMHVERFAHPLVRDLFNYCRSQLMSITKLAERSGVGRAYIYRWKADSPLRKDWNGPSLFNLDRCYTAIGFRIMVIPEEWCSHNNQRMIQDIRTLEAMIKRAKEVENDQAIENTNSHSAGEGNRRITA